MVRKNILMLMLMCSWSRGFIFAFVGFCTAFIAYVIDKQVTKQQPFYSH